jgi:peroxiredoxin
MRTDELLTLPVAILSDERLELAQALRLPTFETTGLTLFKRFTLVISGGRIEHVLYPVFPSDRDTEQVIGWLNTHPA